jgi:hypothetical protein
MNGFMRLGRGIAGRVKRLQRSRNAREGHRRGATTRLRPPKDAVFYLPSNFAGVFEVNARTPSA